MTIIEFFERSVGKWRCQRSSYHLGQADQWNHCDSTYLTQEILPPKAGDVLHLCELCHRDARDALGGLYTQWQKSQAQSAGSSLLVPLKARASPETLPTQGRILRSVPGSPPTLFHYQFGSHDCLILTSDRNHHYVEERIWFAAMDLRLRTSLISIQGHRAFTMSCFHSETRLSPGK
jgi:hypothetical protein